MVYFQKGLLLIPDDTISPELIYQRALLKLISGDKAGCDKDFEKLEKSNPPVWYTEYAQDYRKQEFHNELDAKEHQKCIRNYLLAYLYDTSRHVSIDYSM